MPIIASHHRKDSPLSSDTDYVPSQAWLDDTKVQWGDSGIVLGEESYVTAFFEAFPKEGGFIRGEGTTIAKAEKQAFTQWKKEHACQHIWGRRGYTNGGALCVKCGGFQSRAFHPIVKLGSWRAEPSYSDLHIIIKGWLRPSHVRDTPERAKYAHQRHLRARAAGIDLPPTPPAPMTDDEFMGWVRDPYREACRERVAEWLETKANTLSPEETARLRREIEQARKSDANLKT